MKKITFLATVLSVVVLLASCSKDHGSTLKVSGSIKNGTYSSECNNVRAIANDANATEIARGDFSNGSFSLTLPKDVPASILAPMEFEDLVDDELGVALTLTVSNPDAKGVAVGFGAYKGDNLLDELLYAASSSEGSILSLPYTMGFTISSYIYADSKCTVQGSIENSNMPVTSDIDFTLYKGWTRIYTTIGASVSGSLINATASLSVSISNKAPKNADMAWYFSTDFNLLSLPFKAPLSEEQKTIVENFFNNVR